MYISLGASPTWCRHQPPATWNLVVLLGGGLLAEQLASGWHPRRAAAIPGGSLRWPRGSLTDQHRRGAAGNLRSSTSAALANWAYNDAFPGSTFEPTRAVCCAPAPEQPTPGYDPLAQMPIQTTSMASRDSRGLDRPRGNGISTSSPHGRHLLPSRCVGSTDRGLYGTDR